ncbi:DUF3017 domain-containing protein [Streptomyces durocortorensis]|uniref:DUF3017 domain-containing protein n=1 Tax=Streptomyces durocortorensis TaxID=2811104 RepID=A0ABS2HZE4_9ACTN|nr:DUF3017 domain-containing protein [Streptomyces durocortorensis]MBM7056371.1 DUF3017 domain-containing protein [Streptomyces durocortorensis]
MGAGRSPADPAPTGRAADGQDWPDGPDEAHGMSEPDGHAAPGRSNPATDGAKGTAADGAKGTAASGRSNPATGEAKGTATGEAKDTARDEAANTAADTATPADTAPPARPRRSRRFPRFTRDTARPEGGGRAASGDAPAPARQWPLLTVLCAAGLGLLIVVLDPFDQAFRIGTILIGGALITGAVLRWVVPSVGMLAVRSRFTDLVTYGVMGTLIVLLALVAQPNPWLDVPILEDAVRFTIR